MSENQSNALTWIAFAVMILAFAGCTSIEVISSNDLKKAQIAAGCAK
jgi:hypothetical protein